MSRPNIYNKRIISLAVLSALGTSHHVMAEEASSERIITAPVVVTATRVEQNSFDLPVSIDVVDGETIHDSQQQVNLSEVAARIPGIVVNNRFNGSQDLSISTRGFGARSQFGVRGVRLYADGIPLSMPDGQGQTGTFNLDTAKQIEFMRGPFSALYGNSSGGVVQTLTRDGAKEPTISGGILFGSYNTRRESLTAEGENGGVNYILNAAHYETDGYRDHSKASRDTFHTKLSYKPSDATKITLLATYLDQPDSQDPSGLTPTQYKQGRKQPNSIDAITHDARSIKTQKQAGLVLDHAFSEQQSIRLMGYYGVRDNLQFQTLNGSCKSNCSLPTTDDIFFKRAVAIDRKFGGVDARWSYKDTLANRPFSLVAGLNYESMEDDRRTFNADFGQLVSKLPTRSEIQDVHNFDQFLQATLEPTDRLLFVAGLRHTKIKFNVNDKMPVTTTPADPDGSGSLEYSNTSPVAGITFKVTPTFNLYANYGRGFETPTFIEMTYVGNPNTGAGPNLSLKPSKSKNYEIGAKAFIADNTRVNLALFKVDTEKEIVTDLGQGTTASFKNAGDTERKGLELSLESALPNNFGLYAAYTLMSAEFKDTFCSGSSCPASGTVTSGNKIPGTYTSNAYAEISWKNPAIGFSTALEGVYFSDTYAYDINNKAETTGLKLPYKADSYAVFNLRGGFTQHLGNWKLNEFARIDNLTDREYVGSVKVNTSGTFEPVATRNWTLGLNASYKF
ncbi:MAG: TonB-dependent receptor [Methylotenera sp.]|nr:TonB-dependent receptor [Methylotenera sp.]